MRTTRPFIGIAACVVALAPCAARALDLRDRGQELFAYEWTPGEAGVATGDGLGPVYNANSCATCHQQGGLGGSATNEQNLMVITELQLGGFNPQAFLSGLDRAPLNLASFSGLERNHSTILHRHGTPTGYDQWRRGWLSDLSTRPPRGTSLPRGAKLRFGERDGRQFFVSERSSPALFGAGQINRIPTEAIRALADAQANDDGGIAGQVSEIGGDVGRFGWRAQIASLADFVGSACANELGLEVNGHPQAEDPLATNPAAHGIDLEASDVAALTAFVAALPVPLEANTSAGPVKEGHELFNQIGCANCHVETLADVSGLYSDLLLHEMGPQLADAPTQTGSSTARSGIANMPGVPPGGFPLTAADYLGAFSGTELSSKWRTPPLWCVADTAPYLHDGRAATLHEAIAAHGGEATQVAGRFRRLSPRRKQSLVAFLNALHGPNYSP